MTQLLCGLDKRIKIISYVELEHPHRGFVRLLRGCVVSYCEPALLRKYRIIINCNFTICTENGGGRNTPRAASPGVEYIRNTGTPTNSSYMPQPTAESSKSHDRYISHIITPVSGLMIIALFCHMIAALVT